jgi:2'-5' RNA ligase
MNKLERLFWAINLPSELKEKLYNFQKQIYVDNNAVKWVKPQNYHLTIKFLGETNPTAKDDMVKTVSDSLKGSKGFMLNINGLGFFPADSQAPRIFWAGIGGDLGSLEELFHKVDEVMVSFGYPSEYRKFSPHLTLARIKHPKGAQDLVEVVKKLGFLIFEPGNFKVSSLDLMSSELFPQGPVYRIVGSIKLGN